MTIIYWLFKIGWLLDLKAGQSIQVNLKNGDKFANRVFITASSTEILIGPEQLPAEGMLVETEKTRWIKLKKVMEIK